MTGRWRIYPCRTDPERYWSIIGDGEQHEQARLVVDVFVEAPARSWRDPRGGSFHPAFAMLVEGDLTFSEDGRTATVRAVTG